MTPLDETVFMVWLRRRGDREVVAGEIRYPRLLPTPVLGQIVNIDGEYGPDGDLHDAADTEDFVVDEVQWHIREDGSVRLWVCLKGKSLDKP